MTSGQYIPVAQPSLQESQTLDILLCRSHVILFKDRGYADLSKQEMFLDMLRRMLTFATPHHDTESGRSTIPICHFSSSSWWKEWHMWKYANATPKSRFRICLLVMLSPNTPAWSMMRFSPKLQYHPKRRKPRRLALGTSNINYLEMQTCNKPPLTSLIVCARTSDSTDNLPNAQIWSS